MCVRVGVGVGEMCGRFAGDSVCGLAVRALDAGALGVASRQINN